MSNENLKQFYMQGLQALKVAGQRGHEAASETLGAVTSPELKQLVQQDTEMTQRHAKQLDELLQKAGGQAGPMENPIIEGIQAGAKHIRGAAKDDMTRDAGIVDSAQIALHYYIAAYGSLAAHAKTLGMSDAAGVLKGMADECKQQDQKFTELAERAVNPQSKAA